MARSWARLLSLLPSAGASPAAGGGPLDARAAGAADYLGGLQLPVGVAVVVHDRGAVYVGNGDQPFPMASVAKVPIMLTSMDKAIRENRSLTDDELRLMEEMITLSDHDAAVALWK